MKTLMSSLLALVIVAVTVMAVGRVVVTPHPTGYGVTVDSDWSDVRRIEEMQRTERARIEAATAVTVATEREQTARIVAPILAIALLGVVALAAWVIAGQRRPQEEWTLLLAYVAERQSMGHNVTLERIGGKWMVADHEERVLLGETAVRRLIVAK